MWMWPAAACHRRIFCTQNCPQLLFSNRFCSPFDLPHDAPGPRRLWRVRCGAWTLVSVNRMLGAKIRRALGWACGCAVPHSWCQNRNWSYSRSVNLYNLTNGHGHSRIVKRELRNHGYPYCLLTYSFCAKQLRVSQTHSIFSPDIMFFHCQR